MKKTILALAVPVAILAAGTAHAGVSLYNQDGVSVDVSGAAEIQYIKNYKIRNDPYLRVDDADLIFTTSAEVTDNLKAVAGIGFQFESDTDSTLVGDTSNDIGETQNDELYVGLSSNFGTLTFGRQLLISDDMGNGNDHELGTIQIGTQVTAANQVIKWIYDQGMFYAGLNVALDKNIASAMTDREVLGARIGVRPIPGLDARLYYYDGKSLPNTLTTTFDQTVYNLEIDYTIDVFEIAGSYGYVENTENTVAATKEKKDFLQLSGVFHLNEKTSFAAGFDFMDAHIGAKKHEAISYYTNVGYQLHANARVYAEIGNEAKKVDGVDQDRDFGYLVGMEVKF